MPDLADQVLYPSKRKWINLIIGGLVFTSIGIFIMDADDGIMRWVVIVFFGIGTLAGFATLLPNSGYLMLDRDGFTARSMFRDSRVMWSDVKGFSTMTTKGGTYVVYDKGEDGMLAAVNRMVGDMSNALPDTYGMDADDLAALMERYRMAAQK